jgi:hypothetical protein
VGLGAFHIQSVGNRISASTLIERPNHTGKYPDDDSVLGFKVAFLAVSEESIGWQTFNWSEFVRSSEPFEALQLSRVLAMRRECH